MLTRPREPNPQGKSLLPLFPCSFKHKTPFIFVKTTHSLAFLTFQTSKLRFFFFPIAKHSQEISQLNAVLLQEDLKWCKLNLLCLH